MDLNEKVGGMTVDIEPTVERFQADQPALRNAYLSGAINNANNLDRVAIIDLRGPDPGAFHDAYRSWAIRARLEREQGHYRNHVIWMGHVPLMGDPRYVTEGLVAMDRWLAAVEQDGSATPLASKIVSNRPADINDRCSQIPEVEQVSVPGLGQVCKLEHVETRYGTPATVAGESIATDTNKCTLKPHLRLDYYPVEFTRRPVGTAPERLPDRRLRLDQARRRPARHAGLAELPGRRGQRDLWRPVAWAGARRLRSGLDEPGFGSWRSGL